MPIGTGVFPIGFKSFNYNEELPFNSFWSWTCVIIRTVIEAHYWWWSNPRHGTIQLELTCYHCMVESSRGDCPFVALRSTDMTTERRVWHGLSCEQCNPRNVMRPSDAYMRPCILGSDNGLSPGRRQTIETKAGILLIWPLGTNFSEILIGINTFSFKKMHLKMSSGKWWPFVLASMC